MLRKVFGQCKKRCKKKGDPTFQHMANGYNLAGDGTCPTVFGQCKKRCKKGPERTKIHRRNT